MATGLFAAGKAGLQLYRANDTFPNETVWLAMRTPDPVIPDDGYSTPIALNAGLNVGFNILFDTAPTGDAFEVLYSIGMDFDGEYVLSTVPVVSGQTLYTWTTQNNIRLDGRARIHNLGGEDIIECWVQEGAATFG